MLQNQGLSMRHIRQTERNVTLLNKLL
uniref:Uncharacterized protein n=1 Tax=Anguilla anguilla TaxID=7936 RepID=A0A0E9UAK8_ANGAN